MLAVKFDLSTWVVWIEASTSDVAQAAKGLFGTRSDRYIDYSSEQAQEAYQDSDILFVTNRSGTVATPYEIVHDYRTSPCDPNWGNVSFEDRHYSFPGALVRHRAAMIQDFESRNLLKKGNQRCPRVKRFETQGETPNFVLQEAHYYDQVGTNLSVDYPLENPIVARGYECHSVRQWDIIQSQGEEKRLPKFEESRLANTLGVAIGISARSREGQTHWLQRRRAKDVATYAGMWHLPFSFALCIDDESRKATDLKSLIRFDLGHERGEELGGLEHSDFGELKPIAFCRDLARGGKPQLFLEMPCFVPFEQIRDKVQENTPAAEFSSKIEVVPHDHGNLGYSSELACFLLLVEDRR